MGFAANVYRTPSSARAVFDPDRSYRTLLHPDGYLGPYAINAVIILAFLFGLAGLLWRRSLVDILTCLVVAAGVPMFWHTMTEARPDLPWGLALGLAVGAILYRPFLQRSRWSVFGLAR